MKIIEVKTLVFPEVKVISFQRFSDNRGFFSEIYRRSDFNRHPKLPELKNLRVLQANISSSKKNVIRGLHCQWKPYMGKLVKVNQGTMVDMFLDIRIGSKTFGYIGLYKMRSVVELNYNEWIWIPPGFAHGGFFLDETIIEYFCTNEYNPITEAVISPLSPDFNWSLSDNKLHQDFDRLVKNHPIISEKDQKGDSLKSWLKNPASKNFIYGDSIQ